VNCENLSRLLSQNEPLSADALRHRETCPTCRGLASALAKIDEMKQPGNAPRANRLARINEQIRASLDPVRPLPSDGKMVGIALVVFVAFSLAVAFAFGCYGLMRMTSIQRICYCTTIIVLAFLLSFSTIQQIMPGSKKHWNPLVLISLSLILPSLLVLILFGTGDQSGFVHFGIPCLGIGLLSAALGGLVAFFLIWEGYAVTPIEAGAVTGCLAGLAGVAVLALHCPRFEAAHVIVWHLGALLIASFAGSIAARWWPVQ
jgi:hypothetical protein